MKMINRKINIHNRSIKGLILPWVMLFLLIAMIMAMFTFKRFSGLGTEEFLRWKKVNKNYFTAMAAAEHARTIIRSRQWNNNNPPQTYTLNIDGNVVTITIEDVED